MAAVAAEVCVKAAVGSPDALGDCPFSQRVVLTLEEKKITYDTNLIDVSNKPDWLSAISPEGKLPVLKLDDGKSAPDSDVITQILEEKFPNPSCHSAGVLISGIKNIFFLHKFLKSNDGLDVYLKQQSPYVNGENISAVDLSLAPKLFHLIIVLDHFKGWKVPKTLTYVHAYLKKVTIWG
ncbi:hypothetical protein OPV22_001952 [Ensete ventricosum]|uniref:glutathione transferase n=1 Tax=Ensete ventricosum TaxID=4639 RepID=A0AAV8RU83_ENSVE|nr:hypothetical protein OPV22_001952 [Ensete ventricosum]